MHEKEKTKRCRGDRLGKNVVKTEIIKYVISKNDAVTGSDIKLHLREKYGIVDKNNIENHLKKLKTEYHCIEQIEPLRNGFESKWIVKKIENLEKIRQHFPEIKLNKCKKSLDIVLKERLFGQTSTNNLNFRYQLSVSTSFFDMCIKTDIETLYSKANEIYQYGEGFEKAQNVKKCVNEVYTECIKRISIEPNIWLVVCNEYINDSSISDIYRNSLKCFPNVEISEERFRKILEEMPIMSWEEMSSEELHLKIVKEISIKISAEIFQKALEETHLEFLKISEEILNKMSKEIYKRIVSENLEEMCNKISELKFYQDLINSLSPRIIFEHFFHRDIIEGTVSSEEKDFVIKKKDTESNRGTKTEPISVRLTDDSDVYAFLRQKDIVF
jgi:hypothetical protein